MARAAHGRHGIAALIAALKGHLGNPALSDVLDAVEEIYLADGQAHWDASRDLAKAATDIMHENDI